MSDTNKSNKQLTAAAGELKTDKNKSITIEKGVYGPSKDEINLAGQEIRFDEECIVKVENGKNAMFDKKTGSLIGYLDDDGTLRRKINSKEKREER